MNRDHVPPDGLAGDWPPAPIVVRSGGQPPSEPPEDPDRELVARAATGDTRALASLLGRHYDRIHRFACRLTGRPQDAEDIAQDVCLILVEKIGTFKGEAKFTTWLMGIVLNACRDHRRRRGAWMRAKAFLMMQANLSRRPGEEDPYTRIWLENELARLQPPMQETVVLVFFEGMTHAEAARVLGVAESTVSGRIHEFRRKRDADGKDGANASPIRDDRDGV